MSRVTRRFPFGIFLATLAALTLAYQVRAVTRLDIGGKFDAPFLARFHDIEGNGEQTYRWTRASARVTLPALNPPPPWELRVRLNGFRPEGAARVVLRVDAGAAQEFETVAGWRVYAFDANAPAPLDTGDVTLTFATETFVPKEEIEGAQDPRALGVVVDWVEVAPLRTASLVGSNEYWLDFGQAPLAPPVLPLVSWAFSFALLYATARYLQLSRRAVNIAFAVLILLLALGFALARIFVAVYTAPFLLLTLGVVLGALLLASRFGAPRLCARWGVWVGADERGALIAIALAQVLVKLGGILYPQFNSSDTLFHAHRLTFVMQGQLFFTSQLPDAAQRVVPYPPAFYVVLSPLAPFVADQELLIQIANVLAETLAIFVVYLLARRLWNNARVALCAAFLFAFAPVGYWIYSWGNHTNIFAQFAATVLFAFLLAQRDPLSRRCLLPASSLLLLAALAHLGVFLSLSLYLPLAALLLFSAREVQARRRAGTLLLVFTIGVIAAWLLYYAEFSQMLLEQAQRYVGDFAAGRATDGAGKSFSLAQFNKLGRDLYNQLGLALLGVGVAGLPLLWRRLNVTARALYYAWLGVAVAFALIALASSFSARYTLWATPALALSGGLALAWLLERKRAGAWLAYGICAFAFGQTVWLWTQRVLYAYH